MKSNKWIITGASITGNGHIRKGLRCQDAHYLWSLSKGWGVAVVCDGAGSRKYSDLGSLCVSFWTAQTLKSLLLRKQWIENQTLPQQDEWQNLAVQSLKQVYNKLLKLTKSNHLPTGDLNKQKVPRDCVYIDSLMLIGSLIRHVFLETM